MNRRGIDLPALPAFTDLVIQPDGGGMLHFYARNERGLHVPIETLSLETLRRAHHWYRWHSNATRVEVAA